VVAVPPDESPKRVSGLAQSQAPIRSLLPSPSHITHHHILTPARQLHVGNEYEATMSQCKTAWATLNWPIQPCKGLDLPKCPATVATKVMIVHQDAEARPICKKYRIIHAYYCTPSSLCQK
jgi:hypothetical protein